VSADPLPPLPVYMPQDDGYYYTIAATQETVSDGAFALLTVAQPYLSADAAHSLAGVAARSNDGYDNVQVGWTVDRRLYGDNQPRLFVFYRANGDDTCYNLCGFEPYGPSTVHVGDALSAAVGTAKRFGIQHFDGRWWIAYDSQWIGSFPDTLWAGHFTQTQALTYFGEVAGETDPGCSAMGTGYVADSTASAHFSSITVINGTSPAIAIEPHEALYTGRRLSGTAFRFGGPGYGLC
jgi:hypothetical protein